jgi:hypothetical protein
MADPPTDASEYVEHEEVISVTTRTKKRVKPRDLRPRIVYNSFLEPPPTTDTGSSSQVQTADEEAHEDEPINRNDLLDPEHIICVDRHGRTIIIPYASE